MIGEITGFGKVSEFLENLSGKKYLSGGGS